MNAVKNNNSLDVRSRSARSALACAAAAALLIGAGTALAANPGWFGGIRMSTPSVDASVASLTQEPDATLTLFQMPIRLKLGMEIGLTERDWANDVSGPGLRLDDRLGWQVLGVGSVPLSRNWGVFGKLGAYRWIHEMRSNFSSVTGVDPQPTYGLGLKYNFTDNLSVSGEWDRYQVAPGVRTEGEIDLLSIGLKYKF